MNKCIRRFNFDKTRAELHGGNRLLAAPPTKSGGMKTAYELAMERLNRTAPLPPLTEEQKREIAELESRFKARIAEREITIQQQIAAARAQGDLARAQELEQQLAAERRKLQDELEARKEKIRQGKA
ncbi:MAG: hypothetical protein RMN51_10325 [Verrucomicrobiota bacterium]|nr:hypothetical protein [Limisphaera sp.]MDW8382482.1 hypothetical protein [Verrucomicrobiota bacterium]